MKRQINYRQLSPEFVEFRAISEDGKRYLQGYASVFNQRSKPILENGKLFYEIIDPRAFDDVLKSENLDVKLNFNHERGRVMARTISGTLKLSTDEKGLLFRAEVPNVSYANDVYELVSRGDLFENSFAFIVRKGDDVWTKDNQGNDIRTINRVAKLIDVSVVVDGAYANTEVSARKDERGKTITITINDDESEDPEDEPMDASIGPIEDDACKTKKPKREDDYPISENSAENDFISNCIKEVMDKGETDDNKQAYAICKSKWDSGKRELEHMRMHIKLLKLKNN